MKKLVFLLFLLFPLFSMTQIKTWNDVNKNSLIVQHDWRTEQPGQYGSFWWLVRRTSTQNNNGWYSYYINLYSNSYLYNNGIAYKSTAYISNITVTMFEYKWAYYNNLNKYDWKLYNTITWKSEYKICSWDESNLVRFWSHSQYCVFKISYGKISPYDYVNK